MNVRYLYTYTECRTIEGSAMLQHFGVSNVVRFSCFRLFLYIVMEFKNAIFRIQLRTTLTEHSKKKNREHVQEKNLK